MKRASWILVGLMALIVVNEAPGQFYFSNTVTVGPFAGSRSYSWVRIGPRHSFVGYHYRSYFPTFYYPPFYWGDPYWGSGSYYSNPTIVIYPTAPPPPPAPAAQAGEETPKGKLIIWPRKEEAAEKIKPLPGKEAGGFRPLQPDDRARALQPLPSEPPRPAEPAPPAAEPPKDATPIPVDLINRGKQAFAAQEYGRAERLFRKATEKEPQNPLAYFLLAQAQFALAKYEKASQSIHDGLRLQSDWPKSDFRPISLYGKNEKDFQERLDHLQELVDQKPSDPVLLVVLAYQLWFAVRHDEAKAIFERAREVTSDKTGIDLFLQAK